MQKHLVIMIWDLGYGGIQTRIASLLTKLSESKYRSIKITLLLKRSWPRLISLPQLENLEIKSFSTDTYRGQQLQFLVWLIKQLWQVNPTHILTFSDRFSALAASFKKVAQVFGRKVKVTISEEIVLSKYLKQYEKWYWFFVIRVTYPWASQILVLTKAMKLDLQHFFSIPNHKINVLPTWISLNSSHKTQAKNIDLLFVGRLSPEKRVIWVIFLAKFFRQHRKKVTIVIAGSGIEFVRLKKLVALNHLENYLTLLNYQTQAQVQSLMKSSKVLLLPSQNEGLPMVILEAARFGVPTIAADFVGVDEVIDDQRTGIIVHSLAGFCDQTTQLLTDPARIYSLGEAAQAKVKREFSLTNLDQFLALVLK